MFKEISGIMENWYELINTFFITINFYNAMKMNCALMFMISIHYERKCLSFLLRYMFKVISDII